MQKNNKSDTAADSVENKSDFDEVYGVVSDVDSEITAVSEDDNALTDYEVEVVELDSELDVEVVEVDLGTEVAEGREKSSDTDNLWLAAGAEKSKPSTTEDTEISEVNSEDDTEIDDLLDKPLADSILRASSGKKKSGKRLRDKLRWSFNTDPLGNSIIILFLIFLVVFGIYVLKEIF